MNTSYTTAVARGFSAIKKIQLRNGGFPSITSNGKTKESFSRMTTFYTGLIACAISESDTALKNKILRKCGGFLLTQKSAAWTFNYWDLTSREKTPNYPDDLDDTSVCLSALFKIDNNFISEEILVAFVNTLIALEEKPGGPYNTWILNNYKNTAWHDIDVAVNANIAHFLNLQKISLDGLNNYLDQEISCGNFKSKYYHKKIAIIYFLSKWYRGTKVSKLLKIIDQKVLRDFKSKSHLDLAQGISAWIRFGGDLNHIEKPLAFLIKNQNEDGSFAYSDFFIEQIKEGKKYYSGCAAFVTACAIEAICVYQNAITSIPIKQETTRREKLSRKIQGNVCARLASSPRAVRDQLTAFISKLSANDKHFEVTLLPYFIFDSLKSNSKNKINESQIFKLCEANLCGWICYTIYDAIIDGEKKESLLPLANVCMREVVLIYQEFLSKKKFLIVKRILNTIEFANLWEYEHCKFAISKNIFTIPEILPDYKNLNHLAHKSLGHALGPIAIMQAIARGKGEAFSARLIENFFIHYLIARQLNDDAHDWLADLREGFINPAGAVLLIEWKKKFPKRTILDLSENSNDSTDLQKLFWDSTIVYISKEIISRTKRARKVARKISELASLDYIESLLAPLESSARSAITERDRTKKFLAAYNK